MEMHAKCGIYRNRSKKTGERGGGEEQFKQAVQLVCVSWSSTRGRLCYTIKYEHYLCMSMWPLMQMKAPRLTNIPCIVLGMHRID